ncbi:MAG: serine/threonine protein kinase [Gemmatimonadaceae bacterium]|nr:serine/threonine protein kinase [Gemmatimonadaceae bacterium]
MTDSLPTAEPDLRSRLERELGDAYVIQRELGGGGSAKVFLATETALDRPVVLKVLPPSATIGVDGERFRREILIAARLQHPHLVPLLQAGTVNEAAGDRALRWFSMPYVDGQTLREQLVKRSRLGVADGTRLLRELASALSYAHARGVVHRDIKPENVLLSDGAAMIADFGVAKALDDASEGALKTGRRVTTVSMALGTPAYMSPEQINKAPTVDHKADLYAFGCLAYELFAGKPPLERETLRATLAAQVQDPPAPLHSFRPDLPETLSAVIMRCLHKDPLQRPHSASVIVKTIDELQQIARSDSHAIASAADVVATATGRAPTESRQFSVTAVGALIAAIALAGVVSWWYFRGA